MSGIGYERDKCHFCNKHEAGFGRAEDQKPTGPYFDACEECAKKPYPQPKQFKEENRGENS